jgi:xanthine dehydrogenase small subunit
VLLGRPGGDRPWRFDPVNACILTMAQLDGAHALTIECVADGGELHEVQRAMCDNHGSQCGFCTPGFVMAMLGHFEHHPDERATGRSVMNHLTGNLCRCTGYLPILEAAEDVRPERLRSVVARHHNEAIERSLSDATTASLSITSELHGRIDAPTTLGELVALRAAHPRARIVSGNTDLGVLVNKQKLWPAGELRHAISLHLLRELARATLAEGERACVTAAPDLSSLLRVFASPQIKCVATLVGNVANGSPIGDTIPSLFALGAEVELAGPSGARWVPIDLFYTGYRQSDLRADEVIRRVRFAAVPAGTVFRAYKVCQRRDLDISYVGCAFSLALREDGAVASARVAYGGVGPTVLRLESVERALVGVSPSDQPAWESVARAIEAAVTPRSDLRGSDEGRRILSANLFRKLGHELRSRATATAEVRA